MGLPKDQKRLLQGNNSEFPPIPPFCAKNRLENHCESSSLLGDPPKIPCAAEQGINSTGTGKPIFENRELIRHNRETDAKSRRTRFTSNTFSVEDKKIIHYASLNSSPPQIMSVRALHFHGDSAS